MTNCTAMRASPGQAASGGVFPYPTMSRGYAHSSPAAAPARRSRPWPPPDAAPCTRLSGSVLTGLSPLAGHPERRPRNARPDRAQPRRSLGQLRDRPHRRARAAHPLEREALEPELALADEILEVREELVVNHPAVAADAVVRELLRAGLVGRRTLDAVDARALVREPDRCLVRQTRVHGHDLAVRPVPCVEAGAHEHDVPVDLDAGLLLGALHLVDVDRPEIGAVAQVEAHRLAAEPVERQLVDGVAALLDVERRVDMRADVLEHREVVDRVRHRVARLAEPRRLRHLVRDVGQDDGRREERVGRHLVLDADRKIDESRPALALGEKRGFGGAHPSLLVAWARAVSVRRSITRRDLNSVVGSVFGAWTTTCGVTPHAALTRSRTASATARSCDSTSSVSTSSSAGRSTTIRYSGPTPGTEPSAFSITFGYTLTPRTSSMSSIRP